MKALKIIAPVLALGLSFTAIANAKDTLPYALPNNSPIRFAK